MLLINPQTVKIFIDFDLGKVRFRNVVRGIVVWATDHARTTMLAELTYLKGTA